MRNDILSRKRPREVSNSANQSSSPEKLQKLRRSHGFTADRGPKDKAKQTTRIAREEYQQQLEAQFQCIETYRRDMKSGAEHKGITSGEIPLAKKVPRCYQEGLLGAGYKEAENYLSYQHEQWQRLVRKKLQDSNYKIKEKTGRKHYDKYIELRGDNANPYQGSKIDGDAASGSNSNTLIGANDYFTERYSYTNPRVSAYDSELSGGCVINATMTLLHLCGFDAVSQNTLAHKLDYKWWPTGLAADDRKIPDVLAELSQSKIKYEITWVKPHNPRVESYLRIDNQYPFDEFRDIVKKGPVIVSVINTNDVKHTLVVDQIDANGNVCILDAHPNYASQYKVSQSTWENTKIAFYVVPG